MRQITCVNFVTTLACNRDCPHCCENIHARAPWVADWAYMEHAAKFMYGIDRINLTGGEPTLHPHFAEWLPKLKALFGCNRLTMTTNGYGLAQHPELARYFDHVGVSHYGDWSYPNAKGNDSDALATQAACLWARVPCDLMKVVHVDRGIRRAGMCARGRAETVEYCQGLVYACCVGSGVPEAIGVPLSATWKEDAVKLTPPCMTCWFA